MSVWKFQTFPSCCSRSLKFSAFIFPPLFLLYIKSALYYMQAHSHSELDSGLSHKNHHIWTTIYMSFTLQHLNINRCHLHPSLLNKCHSKYLSLSILFKKTQINISSFITSQFIFVNVIWASTENTRKMQQLRDSRTQITSDMENMEKLNLQ